MSNEIFILFLITISCFSFLFQSIIPKAKKNNRNLLSDPSLWIVIIGLTISWIICLY